MKFGRGGGGGGKAIKSAIVCDQPFLFSFFLAGGAVYLDGVKKIFFS